MNWYKIAQSSMNVFTNLDGVKEAFKEMENEDIEKAYGWDHLEWVLGVYHKGSTSDFESEFTPFGDDLEEIDLANIYGAGGWNRYYVDGNGDVSFSEMHGRDHVDKARVLGFRII